MGKSEMLSTYQESGSKGRIPCILNFVIIFEAFQSLENDNVLFYWFVIALQCKISVLVILFQVLAHLR